MNLRPTRARGTVRHLTTGAVLSALALSTLTACGGDSGSAEASGYSGEIGAVDLSDVCPATVVVQTDWNPEAEHGHIYELLGPDPKIDAGAKKASGPLFSSGEYTGVDVEIRVGGPAIGFQAVSAQMYTDPDITLGFVDADQAIQVSSSNPVTSVFAPFEINPMMIMWDPETYPDVKEIADLKEKEARVLTFETDTYWRYLTGAGILDEGQIDGSYDGSTSSFVADQGKSAQQGFVSSELYVYENDLPEWNKPIAYQLVHDAGYPSYKSAVSVRSGEVEELTPCLEKLVPVLQQGVVDYLADPQPTTDLMLDMVDQYSTGWVYSQEQADYGLKTIRELGLVSDGTNGTIGDFDPARWERLIELNRPIFAEAGIEIAEPMTPETVMTNEFIDPSISLGY
ncbi:ABC transporter substrate-binding protein [Rhodococcus sp. IEGM 1408]|uniref:ABC transporter substrate-binding protein n=1 Tax=Rhodococcus sp. IEGM 1408 TaxID=3082220 RepID=UPI002954CB43|nr:ABC transporter substrate-binding protein [Rhodococcus sp. IEGM 1408]MDV8001504.1 ABC transporter substrate-binding protein [Rhodococcus sp. IEGM 1408]